MRHVSILTRPFDRMRLQLSSMETERIQFQSSSGRKTGCNTDGSTGECTTIRFQSSSGRKTGCNGGLGSVRGVTSEFQSSSGLSTGCNLIHGRIALPVHPVSILIQPLDRMRRFRVMLTVDDMSVSILIRSKDRMQQVQLHRAVAALPVSILIRSFDRMQPAAEVRRWQRSVCFNPHPVERPDAT